MNCPRCGTLSTGWLACPGCALVLWNPPPGGAPTSSAGWPQYPPAPPQPAAQPWTYSSQSAPHPPQSAAHLPPVPGAVSARSRVAIGAKIVDISLGLVLTVVSFQVLMLVLGLDTGASSGTPEFDKLVILGALSAVLAPLSWVSYETLTPMIWGGTIGQRILGLRLIDRERKGNLGFWVSLTRGLTRNAVLVPSGTDQPRDRAIMSAGPNE